MKSLSRIRLFATPWTVAYQAPLSVGFSRQQYWSGLPFPSPVDLPKPGIEPGSPALQTDALPSEPPGKSEQLSSKRTQITMLTRMQRKGNLVHCWWEHKLVPSLWKTVLRFLKKIKIRLACEPAFYYWVYTKKDKNTNLKRYMHPNVQSSITHNCQGMEVI